ncbi:hypothetical protein K402DRAFT_182733 [Aulographum hederae CBS 113979]|uniref:Uncharacterized protein n=1 Tax=Aulographum hederae CBS 113979 TaxID=1176131 RepID=A0A6G1GQT3_9PEZI|nr:hypothetical protein K402DRAFT_182733 [Aulographum hederae CBS 113979]
MGLIQYQNSNLTRRSSPRPLSSSEEYNLLWLSLGIFIGFLFISILNGMFEKFRESPKLKLAECKALHESEKSLLESRISKLELKLSTHETTIKKSRATIAENKAKISKQTGQIEAKENSISALTTQITAITAIVDELGPFKAEAEDLRGHYTESQNKYSAGQRKVEELDRELAEKKRDCAKQVQRFAFLQEKLARQNHEQRKATDVMKKEFTASLEELRKEMATKSRRVADESPARDSTTLGNRTVLIGDWGSEEPNEAISDSGSNEVLQG